MRNGTVNQGQFGANAQVNMRNGTVNGLGLYKSISKTIFLSPARNMRRLGDWLYILY